MLYDVTKVEVIENYTLRLHFENNVEGYVDISTIIPFEGIFSKLSNKDYFATVYVDPELGTIVWDNGADISPEYLYSIIADS